MTKTEPAYVPPKWSTGTDAEIIEALNKHYKNEINLHDYWSIGDERVIHLSAMSATGVDENHVEQDITMVLMNKGGKKLIIDGSVSDIDCAFIIGQKDSLNDVTSSTELSRRERGYMNATDTVSGGWHDSNRRAWCNSTYRNAFPSTIIDIFKQFANVTANGTGSTTYTDTDYFALAAEKEIYGWNYYGDATAEESLSQFEYYQTTANLIKHVGILPNNYSAESCWTRTVWGSASYNDFVIQTGDPFLSGEGYQGDARNASSKYGIAPFGCI